MTWFTSWSSCNTSSNIHLIGVFETGWKCSSPKFGSDVPEPAGHVQTLKKLESALLSSRKSTLKKSGHARRSLILKPIRKSEKRLPRTTLKLGVNTPKRMAKRSISSRSPNSCSGKRYRAHTIIYTNLRHYDERHKIRVSGSNFAIFDLNFLHVI